MTYYNPQMAPKVRSQHIMDSAKGKPCTLRIASFYPGYSCASDETTVGCHLPVGGKGKATKVTDLAVVFGCKHCHDILDGADWKRQEFITEKYPMAYADRLINAMMETHAMLVDDGLLVVPGARIIR